MLVAPNQKFDVAPYHLTLDSSAGTDPIRKGPVLPLRLRFQYWLPDTVWLDAHAFVDPGADVTEISLRWLHASTPPELRGSIPADPGSWPFIIQDPVWLEIGGRPLEVPRTSTGPKFKPQGEFKIAYDPYLPKRERGEALDVRKAWWKSHEMPGYEDLLLGRDFLARHELLMVLNGADGGSFSLLLPEKGPNTRTRDRVLATLKGEEQPAGWRRWLPWVGR